jgi:hypothetical protein
MPSTPPPEKTPRELFNAAMSLPESERSAWLEGQLISDALRQRVRMLLRAEATSNSPLGQAISHAIRRVGNWRWGVA